MKDFLRNKCLKVLKAIDQQQYVPVMHADRTCNICGFHGTFRPFGFYYIRPDAICPKCKSFERHRLFKFWFQEQGSSFADARVLHFAPERAMTGILKDAVRDYETADLKRDNVDHNWNIEEIACEDNSFDLIVCSHVLEHVDTEKALAELRRCLKPGGTAAVMIPICEGIEKTYLEPAMAQSTKQDRWMHFHQYDHIRIIGRDFRDQVKRAGFHLTEYTAEGTRVAKHGLNMGEKVFVLT